MVHHINILVRKNRPLKREIGPGGDFQIVIVKNRKVKKTGVCDLKFLLQPHSVRGGRLCEIDNHSVFPLQRIVVKIGLEHLYVRHVNRIQNGGGVFVPTLERRNGAITRGAVPILKESVDVLPPCQRAVTVTDRITVGIQAGSRHWETAFREHPVRKKLHCPLLKTVGRKGKRNLIDIALNLPVLARHLEHRARNHRHQGHREKDGHDQNGTFSLLKKVSHRYHPVTTAVRSKMDLLADALKTGAPPGKAD